MGQGTLGLHEMFRTYSISMSRSIVSFFASKPNQPDHYSLGLFFHRMNSCDGHWKLEYFN